MANILRSSSVPSHSMLKQLAPITAISIQSSPTTKLESTKPAQPPALTPTMTSSQLDHNALIGEINTAKTEDLKSIHTQGHWVRDMRSVGYLYQWIDRAAQWVPVTGLSVAALIIGVTAATSTALIATMGIAALAIPIAGIFVTSQAWSERESNKNQTEKRLTNEFRSQRSALLSGKPEKNGFGKVNEFSRFTTAMNHYVFSAIEQHVNQKLHLEHKHRIQPHEFKLALKMLLGSQRRVALTPVQAKNFREELYFFMTALRQIEAPQVQLAHNSDFTFFKDYEKVKQGLAKQGFSQTPLKRYSEDTKSLQTFHLLEPIELSEQEFQQLKNGEKIHSRKVNSQEIDQIISIKKIQHADESVSHDTRYRLFATSKLNAASIHNNQDQIDLIKDQLKRAMLARAETTWAGHGVDSLAGIFRALSNPKSKIFQPDLANRLLHKNQYLQSWALNLAPLNGSSHYFAPIESAQQNSDNLYHLDLMTQMSSDEYDYLLLERTGSRSPISTGGQKPHFLKQTQYLDRALLKRQRAEIDTKDVIGPIHADGVNLPFNDKLRFSSTHCAPFHSHEYFLKLHALDMVDYRGVDTSDQSIATPLSRRAMINIYEDKAFQKTQYYSEHGFAKAAFTKRQPGFGPVEDNNSKSIVSSIKRFNSSRDLSIALACLYKKDLNGKNFNDFDFTAVENSTHENESNVTWNPDPLIQDMNHAMNISMLHNEIRKLEASIHDLGCVINEYQNLKGACSLAQQANRDRQSKHTGANTTSYLDTVIFQKKIKVLTSEVADQINNLFKTQIDYTIAYSHDQASEKPKFSGEQQTEMGKIFDSLNELTQSPSLKALFERTHKTISHHRNRLGGGSILNGFKGRARIPFARRFTFRGSMERLLTPNISHGLDTFRTALSDVTESRFKLESVLGKNSTTLKNMEFIESVAL